MITQTPETRELYEACLKAKRDEEARLAYARSEGLAEGRTEGEKIGLTRGEQLGLVRGEQLGLARGEQLGLARGEQLGLARGEQLGLARGEKIGQIRLLERMLHRSPTPDAELAEASLEDLAQKLESLEQLSQRPGAGG
jgi:flagellar biosynthesis/type III secretory pathway protein FliH